MYKIIFHLFVAMLCGAGCGSGSSTNGAGGGIGPSDGGASDAGTTTPPSTTGGTDNASAGTTSCSISYGKAFAVASVSGPARAILSVIGYSEGTGNCYNFMFGFAPFNSYADHPNICQPFGKSCSTAAGRYQLLYNTWTAIKSANHFTDFSPPNQDKSALYLANRRGFTTYDNALSYTEFSAAIEQDLSYEWSSMPPGRYGQGFKTIDQLWTKYQAFVSE